MITEPFQKREDANGGGASPAARWTRATTLSALREAGGILQVHAGGHVLAFVETDEQRIHAIDDRCPHMGFPMHQGSVSDGIVTCHWHHARFDLEGGGTLDPWADDLRSFGVELRGDEVWVDLRPRAGMREERLKRLRLGLEQDIPLVVAKACLALAEGAGESPDEAVDAAFAEGYAFGVRYRQAGWGSGLTILGCARNLWPHLDEADRPRALYQGLSAVARDSAGAAPRFGLSALPEGPEDLDRLERWLRRAVELRDVDGIERIIRTAIAAGADDRRMAAMLFGALTDHRYVDLGHPLDFTNKAFEALDVVGWDRAAELLPSLAGGYARAMRMEESSAWRHPIDLVGILDSAFERLPAAYDSGRGLTFSWDGRSALVSVLLGEDPQAIADALLDSLAAGFPPTMVSSSVAYAAALRIAAFPTSNEFPDWDTALHTFTFANAVDQGLRRVGDQAGAEGYPLLLRGVFDAAMSVYLDRFLNVPAVALPEPSGETEDPAALLAELPKLLERRHSVDAAGELVSRFLFGGGEPADLQAVLGRLLLREDRDFHTIQMIEAAFRQYETLKGKPAGAAVLVAAARYLAAHAPTMRAQGQTYEIARRLHRGEKVFD